MTPKRSMIYEGGEKEKEKEIEVKELSDEELKELANKQQYFKREGEWKTLLEQVFLMSVEKFYELIFSDDSSKLVFGFEEH